MIKDGSISSQRQFKCSIVNCEHKGRKIAQLGTIPLSYCPKHRDYGVRILNFLVDSKFRNKFLVFLNEFRNEMFMLGSPEFCEQCNNKLHDYITTKSEELIKLENLEDEYKPGEQPEGEKFDNQLDQQNNTLAKK